MIYNIPVTQAIIIELGLFLISLTTALFLAHKIKTTQYLKKYTQTVIMSFAVLTFFMTGSLILIGNTASIIYKAKIYGMWQDLSNPKWTLNEIQKQTELSHVQSQLPKDENAFYGSIIMYYKFGCPDCGAIKKEWDAQTPDDPNIYWVSTRSEEGKKLIQKYTANEVPSGIYVHKNGTYTVHILYKKDRDGKPVFNQGEFDALMNEYRLCL